MNNRDDVFGVLSDAKTGKYSIVILKSKAIKLFVERDGMSFEDAFDYWDYNIAGAKGKGQYSVVDDMLSLEQIQELDERIWKELQIDAGI